MGRGRTARVLTHRYDGDGLRRQPDEPIVEEPMEIHLDGTLVATTMRTPDPRERLHPLPPSPPFDLAVVAGVGRLLLDGALPAGELGLYVSGRASFEIVQKAWAAGIATVVAVSAPSSLAVAAARLAGMTLCGFARGGRLNVYSGRDGDGAGS